MALVSTVEAPLGISNAIKRASKATGTDFNYLLTTAARESNFSPQAKAKTSSAAGLFQFIENTWLQTVKEEGARYGLGKYSQHIFKTSNGRYYVPDRSIRNEILKLRHNAEASAMMAGAFTQQNADFMQSRLGREPNQGELYIAHFLGPKGATKLISMAQENPSARADRQFPKAAHANRGIFYSHGKPRSLSQVYDLLVSDHTRMKSLTVAAVDPARSTGMPPARTAPEPSTIQPLPTRIAPSNVAPTRRVAALDGKMLAVGQPTMTDAGLGSIGAWQTIIQRADPAVASGSTSAAQPGESAAIREAKRLARLDQARHADIRPVSHATATTRSAYKQLASINPSNIASSALKVFERDYWMQLSMDGS